MNQHELDLLRQEMDVIQQQGMKLSNQVDVSLQGSSSHDLRVLSEQVTSTMLHLDGLAISKQRAVLAVQAGQNELARDIARLLVRRKRVLRQLGDLGARLDERIHTLS
mmetsp:Transcript_2356/g.4064  ORF Transcript_2356/g.4064 Transcript_2356/m.4064 type:complete len:108 (-) Transcript_2356:1773-2096(-)